MCYSVGKSLVTIATTGRQPDSGEILSKNYLPIIVPCSATRYHWPSRFRKTSVWRVRRVLAWPDSRTEGGDPALGNPVSPEMRISDSAGPHSLKEIFRFTARRP